MKEITTSNNQYSTLQLGDKLVQTLTINDEVFAPVRELLVALEVTKEESVTSYMKSPVSNYYKNIKSTGIENLYQLKFKAEDNKYRETDSLNLKDIFNFVAILSPRNKVLKDKVNKYFFKTEEIALGKTPTTKERLESKQTRRSFTYLISVLSKNSLYNATTTNYIYKIAFGLDAVDIRELLTLPSGCNVRGFLSDKCLNYVTSIENMIASQPIKSKDELKELTNKMKLLFKPIKIEVREDTKVITVKQRVLITDEDEA